MRQCNTCNQVKSILEFSKAPSNKDGLRNCCKQCDSLRRKQDYYANIERETLKSKEYYKKNPRTSTKNRWYKYRITEKEYLALLAAQDNKCAICFTETDLCVDHNHVTSVVRGLLCSQCNTALGLVKENANTLKNMLAYLSKVS